MDRAAPRGQGRPRKRGPPPRGQGRAAAGGDDKQAARNGDGPRHTAARQPGAILFLREITYCSTAARCLRRPHAGRACAVVAALVHMYVISRKNKTGACVVRMRAERRCGGPRAADAAAAGVANAGTLGVFVTVGSRRVSPDVQASQMQAETDLKPADRVERKYLAKYEQEQAQRRENAAALLAKTRPVREAYQRLIT